MVQYKSFLEHITAILEKLDIQKRSPAELDVTGYTNCTDRELPVGLSLLLNICEDEFQDEFAAFENTYGIAPQLMIKKRGANRFLVLLSLYLKPSHPYFTRLEEQEMGTPDNLDRFPIHSFHIFSIDIQTIPRAEGKGPKCNAISSIAVDQPLSRKNLETVAVAKVKEWWAAVLAEYERATGIYARIEKLGTDDFVATLTDVFEFFQPYVYEQADTWSNSVPGPLQFFSFYIPEWKKHSRSHQPAQKERDNKWASSIFNPQAMKAAADCIPILKELAETGTCSMH